MEMNIYQKMAAITAKLAPVAKNLMVETGKGKGYKAVSERDIIDAVKPVEEEFGVYSYPFDRELVESEILENEVTYEGKTSKKTTFYTHLKTTYRFVNTSNPSEYIDMVVYSVGLDTQDKGDGKAMTYGDKYALMKAYKISTGDDPDQDASGDNDYKKTAQKPANTGAFIPTCNDCGKEINEREHDYAVKYFGEPLCRACQQKRKQK